MALADHDIAGLYFGRLRWLPATVPAHFQTSENREARYHRTTPYYRPLPSYHNLLSGRAHITSH